MQSPKQFLNDRSFRFTRPFTICSVSSERILLENFVSVTDNPLAPWAETIPENWIFLWRGLPPPSNCACFIIEFRARTPTKARPPQAILGSFRINLTSLPGCPRISTRPWEIIEIFSPRRISVPGFIVSDCFDETIRFLVNSTLPGPSESFPDGCRSNCHAWTPLFKSTFPFLDKLSTRLTLIGIFFSVSACRNAPSKFLTIRSASPSAIAAKRYFWGLGTIWRPSP